MGFDYWDDKDEAIEECLEHCRRKAAKYRGDNGARFETFLVTVARRKALSQIDKRDRRRKLLTENWQIICRQPWVYGAHDAFSLEEDRLISANFDQPMFASFGQ
jgi:DNA-directed RNA polymerase specialized sigma24 family protein